MSYAGATERDREIDRPQTGGAAFLRDFVPLDKHMAFQRVVAVASEPAERIYLPVERGGGEVGQVLNRRSAHRAEADEVDDVGVTGGYGVDTWAVASDEKRYVTLELAEGIV